MLIGDPSFSVLILYTKHEGRSRFMTWTAAEFYTFSTLTTVAPDGQAFIYDLAIRLTLALRHSRRGTDILDPDGNEMKRIYQIHVIVSATFLDETERGEETLHKPYPACH